MVRCIRPSTVATTRVSSPVDSPRSMASRRCSHWRDTVAALWKVKDRGVSIGTGLPDRAARSRAIRSPSLSSAHTTTTGRPVFRASPAAMWARWMAAAPDRAAGHRPPSRAVKSC